MHTVNNGKDASTASVSGLKRQQMLCTKPCTCSVGGRGGDHCSANVIPGVGVVSVTNGTAGTGADTSGRTRRHVFGQRIKRGRAVIPLDVTMRGGEVPAKENTSCGPGSGALKASE